MEQQNDLDNDESGFDRILVALVVGGLVMVMMMASTGAALSWLLAMPCGIMATILVSRIWGLVVNEGRQHRTWRRVVKAWRACGPRLFLGDGPRATFRAGLGDIQWSGLRGLSFLHVQAQGLTIRIAVTDETTVGRARERIDELDGSPDPTEPPPLGEKPFDDRIAVCGKAAKALALMDPCMRDDMLTASQGWPATIDLRFDSPLIVVRDPTQHAEAGPASERPLPVIEKIVEGCSAILGKLHIATDEILPRLLHNAECDRSPLIRWRCLQILIDQYHDTAALPDAVAKALRDSSQAVRAIATTFAGGEAAFAELSLLLEKEKPEAPHVHALAYLVQHFPIAKTRSLVEGALNSSFKPLRHRALCAAVGSGDDALADKACWLLETKDATHAEMVVRSIVKFGGPRVEPALIDLIEYGMPAVSAPAIVAIGEIGTENAVAPLRALLDDRNMRTAAREALQQILDRIGTVGDGRVSIASPEAEAGALSLGADGGSVAIATPGLRPMGGRQQD